MSDFPLPGVGRSVFIHNLCVMLKIFVVLYIIYLLQRKDDYNADEFGESGIDHDFVRITYEIVLTLVIVILIKICLCSGILYFHFEYRIIILAWQKVNRPAVDSGDYLIWNLATVY